MIPVRNFKFSIMLLIFLIEFDGKILTGEVPSRAASVTGNRVYPGDHHPMVSYIFWVIFFVISPIQYIKII